MNKRKYLVYKITNRFNNKIYIGCHSTLNESDRYMGSGVEIREALKKEGRKSFVKEILFVFDTKDEMLNKEKELVTKEFCMDENTYNRIEGGGTYLSIGMITVKDKDGNTSKVYCDDSRYLSGDLVSIHKNNKYPSISFKMKNTIVVRDKNGDIFRIKNDDSRYLTGELVGHSKNLPQHPNFSREGKKHKKESKEKIGLANSVKQKGEQNSQYNTCWITKDGINKKIKKETLDEWINQGWNKGRIL